MAFIDARTLPEGHRIDADLCVIGSGAAGLAIASEFAGSPLRVALLESGGLTPDPRTQALYQGRMAGQADAPLHQSRLRYFGGTTNHWTAHLRPLDPADFEVRPWIPHSGWPFESAHLAPYYRRACEFLGIPPSSFDLESRSRAAGIAPWTFEEDRAKTQLVQILPEEKRRLGVLLHDEFQSSDNVRTYLYANVLEIRPDESGQRIGHLEIRTLQGRRLTARGTQYILAAGGIENARLLLLSAEGGLGNRHGLVGRFFANHLESYCGQLVLGAKAEFYGKMHPGMQSRAVLTLSEEIQAAQELLNCRFRVVPLRRRPTSGLATALARMIQVVDAPPARGAAGHAAIMGLRAVAEQSPNPESRVRLGTDRDAFDQPKVVLDWRLSDADSVSVSRSLEQLAIALGSSGLGRIRRIFPEDGFRSANPRGSFHHMGTTRMHVDPRHGVADADCRLHDLSNLFVAGSSVFPTYGTANPTLTILALSFRLAEHLKALLA
jgi:choline dehydrogenase-like flavoprotein